MSYQNYMKQALDGIYKKKQQTQGYGQQQYNYGGYAGATNSYLPENYTQPTAPQQINNGYMGQQMQQPSPISQALQSRQPQTSLISPSMPGTLYQRPSNPFSQPRTRDNMIALFATDWDKLQGFWAANPETAAGTNDPFSLQQFNTFDEWKNWFMQQYPNNEIVAGEGAVPLIPYK